jgi:hypothetical protein
MVEAEQEALEGESGGIGWIRLRGRWFGLWFEGVLAGDSFGTTFRLRG